MSECDLDENIDLLRKLWAVEHQLKAARTEQKELKAQLMELVGENETVRIGGKRILSRKIGTKSAFNVKGLQQAHPEIYEQFLQQRSTVTWRWHVRTKKHRPKAGKPVLEVKQIGANVRIGETRRTCPVCGAKRWHRTDKEVLAQFCVACNEISGRCKRCGGYDLAFSYHVPECTSCDSEQCLYCGMAVLSDRLSGGQCDECFATPMAGLGDEREEYLQYLVEAEEETTDQDYEGWPSPTV